ncbi:MAG: hypothetical protein AB7P22_02385 [Vicinamibacterales bacterium]
MLIRYGAMALAAFLASATTLSAQPQLTEAQQREVEFIFELFENVWDDDDPAPNELSVQWTDQHFLQAQQDYLYIPFTVSFDRAATSASELVVYWRVLPSSSEMPETDAELAFETLNFATVPAEGPAKISRAFSVPAGSWDVWLMMKEPEPDKRGAPDAKVSLIKHTVEVPNLWNNELTPVIIVADRINNLPAPLTPEQMGERPYAMGTMEVVPAEDMEFPVTGEMNLVMLIFNPRGDNTNKPNVAVEYSFYTVKEGGAEEFYNKTPVQDMNGTTLPPGFSLAMGHQLQTGQTIPLKGFPVGQYRLEVKVTDNLSNQTVTQNVNFTVTGS